MPSCFICERELKSVNEEVSGSDTSTGTKEVRRVRQYVHSTHTGNNYCLPSEGCWVNPSKTTEPSAAPVSVVVNQVSTSKKREQKVQHLNVPFLGS